MTPESTVIRRQVISYHYHHRQGWKNAQVLFEKKADSQGAMLRGVRLPWHGRFNVAIVDRKFKVFQSLRDGRACAQLLLDKQQ